MTMLKNLTRAFSTGIAIVALTGCAALQVDVDVYKGPLVNTDETQQTQLASMAMSARPLVLTMRNLLLDSVGAFQTATGNVAQAKSVSLTATVAVSAVRSKAMETRETGSTKTTMTVSLRDNHIPTQEWNNLVLRNYAAESCEAVKLRSARQLNGVLSFYEDQPRNWDESAGDWDPTGWGLARDEEGISSLVEKMMKAMQKQQRDPDLNREAKHYKRLESMLVDFAARIQFYATNAWLINECLASAPAINMGQGGGTGMSGSLLDNSRRIKPLLETVANTILVQADETRRKAQHPTQDAAYGNLERDAARAAFAVSPNRVYEQMLDDLAGRQRRMERQQDDAANRQAAIASTTGQAAQALKVMVENERVPAEKSALLIRTMGTASFAVAFQSTAEAALRTVSVSDVDGTAAWARDAIAIVEPFLPRGTTTTISLATKTLADWLAGQSNAYKGAAAQSPRARRLGAAAQALGGLTFAPTVNTTTETSGVAALGALYKAIGQQFTAQYQQFLSRKLELADADPNGKLRDGAPAPAAPAGSPTDIQSVEDAKAVRSLLAGVKDEVLKSVGTGAAQDAAAVPVQVRLALQNSRDKLAKEPAGAARTASETNHDKAIEFARQFRMSVASVPIRVTSTTSPAKPVDVVDSVISLLRNQHLEVIQRVGRQHASALYIEEAIAQAQEYRKGMIYVRPSSAYLRSALPATFAQGNPRIGWSNMLVDPIQNVLGIKQDPEKPVKEELDKAFWQNINTVRVGASGSSNFVLAKDDVGNWYVKAMGSDPKAMVNAAKNLALFNMGGKFDANLLRMNELQGKLDSSTEGTTEQRAAWDKELTQLNKGKGGYGATEERSTTLALFRNSYNAAARADADALAVSLKGVTATVAGLWGETLKDDPKRLTATLLLLEQTGIDLAAQATHLDGSVSVTVLPGRIAAALKALDSYRSTLAAKVLAQPDMTAAETLAVSSATTAAADQEAKLTQLDAKVADASTLSADADRLLKDASLQDPKPANFAQLQGASEKAAADLRTAVQEQATQRGVTSTARQAATVANGALREARERRARAATDVHRAIRPLVTDMVDKRLRAVQELETAANVVGRRNP